MPPLNSGQTSDNLQCSPEVGIKKKKKKKAERPVVKSMNFFMTGQAELCVDTNN